MELKSLRNNEVRQRAIKNKVKDKNYIKIFACLVAWTKLLGNYLMQLFWIFGSMHAYDQNLQLHFLGIIKSVKQNFLYFLFFVCAEPFPFPVGGTGVERGGQSYWQNKCKNMVCYILAGSRSCFPIEFDFIYACSNSSFHTGEREMGVCFLDR